MILADGPGIIVCGSVGCVAREKGRRLPNGMAKWVGTVFRDLPDDVLEAYGRWLVSGPDGWYGHSFECMEIEAEWERRTRLASPGQTDKAASDE